MSTAPPLMVRLCRLEELAAGAARGFDPGCSGADTLFVLRRGGTVRAFRNRCPHQGARLEYRKDRFLSQDGRHVVCHAHGARFDPDTGICNHGGWALESLPCAVEQGWIWAATGDTA